MNISIDNKAGKTLLTQGKYCAEDITVVPTLEEKSVTPTESAQEIVPSNGKCGISKVNVGAVQAYQGTATPTKSEQTINPTSGKYFSSFKVAAIPSDYVKPSGTLQITANGTNDVTNYKNVNVNVAPNLEQKTVTITENGTTEVTPTSGKDGMSKVTVTTNVPTASAVEEVATASAMDALLVEANVGKYYKFTGTTDSNYTNGDIYLVEGGAVSSGETWVLNEILLDPYFEATINFVSNSESFSKIAYVVTPADGLQYDDTYVNSSDVWTNTAYRTLTFSTPPTGDLLTWLQANGTKQ